MGYDWTNIAYQQVTAGNTGIFIFGFAVVLVFLVLAALYESWGLPLAIILVVPMCLLSSIAGLVWIAHMPIDIFSQIGFVVLVALAAKNAILIVEYAVDMRKHGMTLLRRDARSLPPAAAADLDDVVRVHLRRVSAGGRGRGRLGNAPLAGHRGDQRHDRRHAVRHLPDAGVLLRDLEVHEGAGDKPDAAPSERNAGRRSGDERNRARDARLSDWLPSPNRAIPSHFPTSRPINSLVASRLGVASRNTGTAWRRRGITVLSSRRATESGLRLNIQGHPASVASDGHLLAQVVARRSPD